METLTKTDKILNFIENKYESVKLIQKNVLYL